MIADLLPNLNVVAVHPRYYSLYMFILAEYWKKPESIANPRGYSRFYRPKEYAHSLACFLCEQPTHPKDMTSVNGARKARGRALRKLPTYATDVPYLQNPLGGYGAAYRTVAASLELIFPHGIDPGVSLDRPSVRGQQLADAFQSAVSGTEYYRAFFESADEVPLNVLQEYAGQACLCRTASSEAPDHQILLDILMHSGRKAEPRRRSMRLYLDMVNATDGYAIDDETFRQLIYFGESSSGASWHPGPEFDGWLERWRIWQAHEYLSVALLSIWAYFCQWGDTHGGLYEPLELERFFEHLRQTMRVELLAERLGLQDPGLDLGSRLGDLAAWQSSYGGGARPSYEAPLSEASLADVIRSAWPRKANASENILTALLMLLALKQRAPLAEKGSAIADEFWDAGWGDGFSLRQTARLIDENLERDSSVDQAIREIVTRVVRLHLQIALSKLPENTFRYQREAGGLRFFNHAVEVGWVSSRYESLTTHIRELGLAQDPLLANHELSDEGLQLLDKGDLEWT
jgi:hypothetical protein